MPIELEGVEPQEMDRLLARVHHDLRKKAIKKAMKAQAMIVVNNARSRIPKDGRWKNPPAKDARRRSKGLRKSQFYKTVSYKAEKIWVTLVGARTSGAWNAWYSHLVEDGHKVIRKRRPPGSGFVSAKGKAHVPGKQFLLKSVRATRNRQRMAFLDELRTFFERASKDA